jgi:hypothetical protein
MVLIEKLQVHNSRLQSFNFKSIGATMGLQVYVGVAKMNKQKCNSQTKTTNLITNSQTLISAIQKLVIKMSFCIQIKK